jgi:glycosidase
MFKKKLIIVCVFIVSIVNLAILSNSIMAKDFYQDKPLTIYHAFPSKYMRWDEHLGFVITYSTGDGNHYYNNNYLKELTDKIDDLKGQGYDAIQILPPQASKDDYEMSVDIETGKPVNQSCYAERNDPSSYACKEWYKRYQPYDFSRIAGIGNYNDLQKLCAKAGDDTMIIADLVFNHMMTVAKHIDFKNAYKDCYNNNSEECLEKINKMNNLLNKFPNFSYNDFRIDPYCRTLQQDYQENQDRVSNCWSGVGIPYDENGHPLPEDKWGEPWTELKTEKDTVRKVHTDYLDMLISAGVRGFRFDAIKHMKPDDYRYYVDYIHNKVPDAWIYGEVNDANLGIVYKYSGISSMGDVKLLQTVESAMKDGELKNLRVLDHPSDPYGHGYIPDNSSVTFARNHDVKDVYGSSDLLPLAWAYILSRQGGTPLVLSWDSNNSIVKNAVKFRQIMSERHAGKEFYLFGNYISNLDDKNFLFLTRGAEGFAMINKADHWYKSKDNDFTLTTLEGCYENVDDTDLPPFRFQFLTW